MVGKCQPFFIANLPELKYAMMFRRLVLLLLVLSTVCNLGAQSFFEDTKASRKWVNKQFKKLSEEEKIAQLMVIRAHSNLGADHVQQVTDLIKKYNVGGLCFFQGGPVRQANLTNFYQSIAKTPLMIAIDGEWGLGMRLDSVINFPRQLMMGAVNDPAQIYAFGKAVGEQCKRLGIQVNYAPDIDVNNNPNNPVINDRSFGEDKYKVARFGIEYMKGMQDVGVMACAKHFPGHGDVAVDSHYDLPIINKTRAQLDELELYPFRALLKAGVGSVMVAHLYIPSIDTTANLATSLSRNNVTALLRDELGFKGITFTDALEMKGVAKYFPAGDAAVQSLIAGNDMLCLPGDIPGSIEKVKQAIRDGKLSWDDLNARVKKVLLAKYHLGLHKKTTINTQNLVEDLNQYTKSITTELAKQAITLLKLNNPKLLPLPAKNKIAYVGIGNGKEHVFAKRMLADWNADIYLFDNKSDSAAAVELLNKVSTYDAVVLGLHQFSRRPANNFDLSKASVQLAKDIQRYHNSISFVFGNPYAINNFVDAPNLLACYENDSITQHTAADILQGKIAAQGSLPVTVHQRFHYGAGLRNTNALSMTTPESVGMNSAALNKIDQIAQEAINKGAAPGCVVLVARKGKLVYNKAFGTYNYDLTEPVQTGSVYDLASVTKISATTVSVMKLYEEGKLDLNKTIGDYLNWTKGSDKASLKIRDILLHQAGLNPFIPFYRETIDTATGKRLDNLYAANPQPGFTTRVAENLYLKNAWVDTMYQRILKSKLTPANKYVYSDNDFIFLGKIVEAISGKTLDVYASENFYQPLGMQTTGFKPREKMALGQIVPTEYEPHFRAQLIRGDVHDEGASMFGGVSGHAGLFSNAYDLAKLYQMLLNGGELDGKRYLQQSTVNLFTAYNSDISRRGLGFDKPEKDNATRKEAYPSKSVSPSTYGHTGFTGTCVWVDPAEELIYIFLSNRVTPTRNNNKLGQLNVRPNIQEAIYQAIIKP